MAVKSQRFETGVSYESTCECIKTIDLITF